MSSAATAVHNLELLLLVVMVVVKLPILDDTEVIYNVWPNVCVCVCVLACLVSRSHFVRFSSVVSRNI